MASIARGPAGASPRRSATTRDRRDSTLGIEKPFLMYQLKVSTRMPIRSSSGDVKRLFRVKPVKRGQSVRLFEKGYSVRLFELGLLIWAVAPSGLRAQQFTLDGHAVQYHAFVSQG